MVDKERHSGSGVRVIVRMRHEESGSGQDSRSLFAGMRSGDEKHGKAELVVKAHNERAATGEDNRKAS